jgi:hypothetical protein
MKKKMSKLLLNRETISALENKSLQEDVLGGGVGTFHSCYEADTCFSCACSNTCQTIFTCGRTCWCV